jgi:hypothetical protein
MIDGSEKRTFDLDKRGDIAYKAIEAERMFLHKEISFIEVYLYFRFSFVLCPQIYSLHEYRWH